MKKNLTFAKLMMLVVMAILPFSMFAQEGKKHSKPAEKYWYIQADGGLSINHGDLANYNGGTTAAFGTISTTTKRLLSRTGMPISALVTNLVRSLV